MSRFRDSGPVILRPRFVKLIDPGEPQPLTGAMYAALLEMVEADFDKRYGAQLLADCVGEWVVE